MIVPRWVWFAAGGAILLVSALLWAHHAGYQAGQLDERLSADVARVDTAQIARAAAGRVVDLVTKAAKPVLVRTAAVHDSVRIVDTVTLTIPGPRSTPTTVEVPAIVIRRIAQDSLSLLAKDQIIASQAAQLSADTTLVNAQAGELATLHAITAPICGAKCKAGVAVVKVAIVVEGTLRLVRFLAHRP